MTQPKYTFTHTFDNEGIEEHYPANMRIEVSFEHDGHISTLVQGFRDFLRGCGWAEVTINEYIKEVD